MDSTGSVLKTFCRQVRRIVNEPVEDSIYTDAELISEVFGDSMTDVFGRILQSSDQPVLMRHTINIAAGTENYQLPPNIRRVVRIGTLDEDGIVNLDYVNRSEFNGLGPGWTLEGNTIAFRPYPLQDGTIEVWYTPSGDVQCHYADATTDGGLYTGDSTSKTFVLASSPTLGLLDRRPNAYVGSILRVLYSNVWQERIITSYDVTTRRVTVREAFSPIPPNAGASSGAIYEIAPVSHASLMKSISLRAAISLLNYKRAPNSQLVGIQREYMSSMKTVLDEYTNINGRVARHVERDTIDNPYGRFLS